MSPCRGAMSSSNAESSFALARRGPHNGEAVRLLPLFEHLPEVHLQHRDRLRAKLAYERVKPS